MAAKGQPVNVQKEQVNMQKEQMFGLAEKEMEYRVDLFNRLTQTCFSKCIEKSARKAAPHPYSVYSFVIA
uniref:Mitochondrial import inner membrane translocase subunit n=5 Tax=Oryza TaxID=4527 RepID=A0A0D3GP30_9ORYZ